MSIEYYVMGKPQKFTDKEGDVIKLRYDLSENKSEEVSPTSAVSVYKYDWNNRLIQTRLALQEL